MCLPGPSKRQGRPAAERRHRLDARQPDELASAATPPPRPPRISCPRPRGAPKEGHNPTSKGQQKQKAKAAEGGRSRRQKQRQRAEAAHKGQQKQKAPAHQTHV